MKKVKKIVTTSLILAVLSVVVLPVISNLNINFGNVFVILSKITDAVIVKASDDYINSGNMLFISDKDQGVSSYYYDDCSDGVRLYTVVTPTDEVLYEYSLNDGEFVECEYPVYGSKLLNLNKDVNTVVVRRNASKEVASKALLINDGNGGWIVLQYKYNRFDEGGSLYTLNYGYDLGYKELYEFSLDGGETFYNIYNLWTSNYFIDYSMKTNASELFNKKIIIRNRETEEIVYKTPELENIEEEYNYENGKTTVNFKQDGFEETETLYEYEINGETKTGTSIELTEDATIKLKIAANKEFTSINGEKDINVKVIKVGTPNINKDKNVIEITNGEIENDELGDIYYSIGDGEYEKYSEKLNLDNGTYKIKAYVVSKNNEVRGNELEEEINVDEPIDNDNKDEEDKDEQDNQNTDNENNEDNDSEGENKEDTASESKEKNKESNESNNQELQTNVEMNQKEIKAKSETPKTSDNIAKIISIFVVILLINGIIFVMKRKK